MCDDQIQDLITNWARKVREWILDRLNNILAIVGDTISHMINQALKFVDQKLLAKYSMPSDDAISFLRQTDSPLQAFWSERPLIARCASHHTDLTPRCLWRFLVSRALGAPHRRCVTGVKSADFSCPSGESNPLQASQLYEHCDSAAASPPTPPKAPPAAPDGEDVDTVAETDKPFNVRLRNVKIAPCIVFDEIAITTPKLASFLLCLVQRLPSILKSLFDTAKNAVKGIIQTVAGWIANSGAPRPHVL